MCSFLILNIANEWHHFSSPLKPSVALASPPSSNGPYPTTKISSELRLFIRLSSTLIHSFLFLWLLLSTLIFNVTHFELIAVCFPSSYLFYMTLHLFFFLHFITETGWAVSKSSPPSWWQNYWIFGPLIPFSSKPAKSSSVFHLISSLPDLTRNLLLMDFWSSSYTVSSLRGCILHSAIRIPTPSSWFIYQYLT